VTKILGGDSLIHNKTKDPETNRGSPRHRAPLARVRQCPNKKVMIIRAHGEIESKEENNIEVEMPSLTDANDECVLNILLRGGACGETST